MAPQQGWGSGSGGRVSCRAPSGHPALRPHPGPGSPPSPGRCGAPGAGRGGGPGAGPGQGIKAGLGAAPQRAILRETEPTFLRSRTPTLRRHHGAVDSRGEAAHHRPLGEGQRGRVRRRGPGQAADRLPLDPEVLRLLREPVQPHCRPGQPQGASPWQEGAHLLRGCRQEPGQHQEHLLPAVGAALRQAARGPRELQAPG